ncbi:MAG: NAD(P)-dependent oxidoreductase, partial [Spirochaetes bacterium]|nr:NAD(P)-dependent oxidoreductase [Spirochaetota bacterium]
ELGAGLVHISTGYVFDGEGMLDAGLFQTVHATKKDPQSPSLRPYQEEDPVNPMGVYGKSKAAGEEAVRQFCSRAVILRTAWLYGRYGNNFVFTMLRLMKERELVRVVNDQRGTPTWAADLARAILAILQASTPVYGTFHFTDGGECTWYEFACEIYRLARELGLLSKDCRLEPISTAEYPTKAKRPKYSVLSKEKIQRMYGVAVPPWKESLERFLRGLKQTMVEP